MKQALAILMALMITAVSLAGCSGEDIGPYQERIDDLEESVQSDRENSTALSMALEDTISTHESTIESNNADISSLNAQIVELEEQIESLNVQIANLENQNSTNQITLGYQSSTIDTLEGLKSALEGQVAALEAANSAALSNIESLLALAGSLNMTISGLSAQNAAMVEENAAANAQISSLQATVFSLQSLATELNDTIELLELPSTLDLIIERGYMRCGVKLNQYGMNWEEDGVEEGLDIEYCKAVAAAIGLDPESDIEYVLAGGSDRFEMLTSNTIDVLIRTSTWTTSRDADLNVEFAGMNFYDGQGIMVREDRFSAVSAGYSAAGLDGVNICVAIGSTSEGNLQDWFDSREIDFTSVGVSSWSEAMQKLYDGECDAKTGDMSQLVGDRWVLEEEWEFDDTELWIATEVMSKEPLGAATKDYDTEWNEVVRWVWYGMVTAEEMGVNSSNFGAKVSEACTVNSAGSPSDPGMCRLLTENFGLGTESNPLSATWMQAVLESVGNYGEAYDDSFCDGSYDGISGSDAMTGCLISRSGTLNALVSEGGIQYAPPMS